MADFNFIINPELREGLESDYRELRACLKAQSWKAVHVLAGSIVEAILIDALSGAGVDQSTLENMVLAPLINLAKDKGILPDEAVELSTVIRKYRNLIHPGRVKRLEKTVDRSGAIVAAEVVEIITKEVAKRKQETYGFTAEQLLDRLRGGSSAFPIVTHLVKDTPKPEIERLLMDVLPGAYFQAIADPDSPSEQDQHLAVCHRKVFDATEPDVREKVTKNLYRICRKEQEATVLVYESQFFRGSDLVYLSGPERQFIKDHFLARVSTETIDELLYSLFGIGPFLNPEEASEVSTTLLFAMKDDDKDLAKRARSRLFGEYGRMKPDSRALVRETAEAFSDAATVKQLEDRESKIKPKP